MLQPVPKALSERDLFDPANAAPRVPDQRDSRPDRRKPVGARTPSEPLDLNPRNAAFLPLVPARFVALQRWAAVPAARFQPPVPAPSGSCCWVVLQGKKLHRLWNFQSKQLYTDDQRLWSKLSDTVCSP